jgi:DNA polymerase-3 subunit alpha
MKSININESIKIEKIEEIDFEGFVYSIKIKNDPSYCLEGKIITKNCDLPDIDMDFEDIKRGEVRKYLCDKYGEFNVSGLSNFLTMKGKGVLRDVSRVFDVPLVEVNTAAKSMLVGDFEKEIEGNLKCSVPLQRFQKKYPDVIDVSQSIEGQIRGYGQHAAGICISKNDLREGYNCNLVSRSGNIVANWDMRNAEYCGLMKLDVLGLSALTILNETKRLIKQNHGVDIDYKKLIFDDPKVFAEITAGHTTGAFQISTHGMTNYCIELGVENFAMIYAVTALWRPGPMQSGMTESYSKRKRGKEKVEKIHPIFDKITAETFGVIVYQEQVMKAVNQLAGIPMAVCNKIRKVMGKSMGHAAFDKYKEDFLNGCKNNKTVSDEKALQIWNMMSESGSYSFNKSHSVTYSMITYYDMFSKTYYPAEFITACLTLGNKDKNVEYIREARRLGLKINLPKIGISHPTKWNCDNKKNLFAPFISIKGVGDVTAEKIAKFKEKKKRVKSFFTLPDESTKINGIDEKTMNILNCVKAFDPDYVTTDEDLRKYKKFFMF